MNSPRKPAPSWWLRGALLFAVLSAVNAAAFAGAQAIMFTVQVVALSDLDSAQQIQTDLLRQGYPAYVVRSHSTEGAVYRVRVGAFANRPAALLYSEAMPVVAGGQPVPALAEGIPPGVSPLAPRLVLSADIAGVDARLVLVGEKLALRTQSRSPLSPAEYAILSAGTVERVTAWQLAETSEGVRTIVRDLPLWPASWEGETSEVLEGYQNSEVSLVAERLGLELSTVRAARYGTQSGVPRLVVVERSVPGALEGPQLIGLGLPATGMTPSGPLHFLVVNPEDLPGLPDGVRLDLAAGSFSGQLEAQPQLPEPPDTQGSVQGDVGESGPDEANGDQAQEDAQQHESDTGEEAEPDQASNSEHAEDVQASVTEGEEPSDDTTQADAQVDAADAPVAVIRGSDWEARQDGPFVRLTMQTVMEGALPQSWRAAFGMPLWSERDYLIAYIGRTLLIYDFLPRD